MPSPEYLSLEDAAFRFDISMQTLRRRIKAGNLTVYRDQWDKRRRLVKVADLEALRATPPAPITSRAKAVAR